MKKCLIVDDQEQNRYLLETLLRGSGYETETAGNGEEALILARAAPPDIMITDVLMPVMDGFTLCQEWKQDETLKSIPVIIYTATYTDAKDEAFALALGADRFLVKPQEPEILLEELKIILRKTEEGSFSPAAQSIAAEETFILRHHEAVIRKLEEKVAELQQAHDTLDREMVARKNVQAALEKEREALKAREAKFRFLTEKMTDIIWTIDLDLKTLYVSPSIEKILGITPEERMSQDVSEQFTPETFSRLIDLYQQEMEKERSGKSDPDRSISLEMEYLHKNGSTIWMESLISGIRDDTGNLAGIHGVSRDISKRKQAEEALRTSEAKLFSILSAAPIGICLMKNRVYQSANPFWCEKFGYTEQSLIGKDTRMMYESEEEFARVGRLLYTNLMKNGSHSVETRLRRNDGTVRNVTITAAPLCPDDLTAGTVAIIEDITESKREKEALKESEEKLSLVMDGVPALLAYVDADLRFVYTNKAYADWYGRTKEDLAGKQIAELLDQEVFKRALPYYQAALAGKDVVFENRAYHKDGRERYVSVHLVPHKQEGIVVGFFSSIMDITERRLAEEKQKEAESLFTAFMNNIPAAVLIKDSDLKPVYANKRFRELFPADDWMGQTPDQTFPPEIANPMIENDHQAISKGSVRYEEQWKTVDGLIGLFETSKFRIERDGKTPFLGCIIVDVTDLRHAENERKEFAERLSRAEKMEALGMLAGGVAHDLNNVLGIMVGYSEMLLDDFDKTSPMRSRMLHIKDASERAAAIVQDLLTLARRGIQNRTVINLNAIITEYQRTPEFTKLSTFHPNVRIKTDYDANLLNIMGSPAHLEKTIMNLVSNAAEAMPHGGLLTMTTGNQYLEHPIHGYDEVREGDYVVINVSDTGEGISAKDINRIFEPFYTKKVMGRSGTGLGLAVVWGTVKDHNGYIDVQSELGKGTTFPLYFPVTREAIVSEKRSVALAEYMGHGESILVVDDVPGQRELAAGMLGKLDYVVHTVASGEEALDYIKTHKVDLIILDMIMDPGIDGLETYQRMLKISPGQKAIIVSGFSETDRVRSAQKLGVGAYVRKPYVLEQLGVAIRNELHKR